MVSWPESHVMSSRGQEDGLSTQSVWLSDTKQVLALYSLQMTSPAHLEIIYRALEGLDHNTKAILWILSTWPHPHMHTFSQAATWKMGALDLDRVKSVAPTRVNN